MRTGRLALGLLIAVLALAGAVGLLLSHTSAQQTRTIHLVRGWNSVTWTGGKQSASQALAGVSDAVSVVYGYNNDSQVFTLYSQQIATLTDFEPEQAYWVLAQRSADWSVPGPDAPSCLTMTPCPTPTQCPTSDGSLTAYQLQEECTAAKVTIEGEDIMGPENGSSVDFASIEQFYNQSCQGVSLLTGSPLAEACTGLGIIQGASIAPTAPPELVAVGQKSAVLVGQYCVR